MISIITVADAFYSGVKIFTETLCHLKVKVYLADNSVSSMTDFIKLKEEKCKDQDNFLYHFYCSIYF